MPIHAHLAQQFPQTEIEATYFAAYGRQTRNDGFGPLGLYVVSIGARALLSSLQDVDWLFRDHSYGAEWVAEAIKDRGIRAFNSGRIQRKKAVKYGKRRYKRRKQIEIMLGRFKDWWRVAKRYDRWSNIFLSAITLEATAIYWL